jgi:pantoate--beta-alanine ligase
MSEILRTIDAMRAWSRAHKQEGHRLGLVPTMGALHRGHLALVEEAQRRVDRVVVSIFVNPLQFGPTEDWSQYPRTFADDMRQLQGLDVAAVFQPDAHEMYPNGSGLTRVTVSGLSEVLCGVTRTTHFTGVSTVVAKLLHIVEPDVVVFGEKDWQQLVVIRRMVDDLNFGVDVVGVPTVREVSGLALSSRNRYLTAEQTERATALFRGLQVARRLYNAGERRRDVLRNAVVDVLTRVGLTSEYVEVVDPLTLTPSPQHLEGPALVALAVHVGPARLIDNVLLGRESSSLATMQSWDAGIER